MAPESPSFSPQEEFRLHLLNSEMIAEFNQAAGGSFYQIVAACMHNSAKTQVWVSFEMERQWGFYQYVSTGRGL